MTGPVSPGRARHRLLSRLESDCAASFTMSDLHDAVVSSYELGERAIPALIGDVFATVTNLQHAAIPLMFTSNSGRTLKIECGRSLLAPGDYDIAISDVIFEAEDQAFAEEPLRSPGRYEYVTGVAPGDLGKELAEVVHATVDVLETLQTWIEDKIFSVVEDASQKLSNGVYSLVNAVTDRAVDQTRIDVAVVGQLAGWRVPNPAILARTIGKLRTGRGRREADALAATFVSTTMPRHELLMARALDAHQAIVVPFREAPYVIAGTYFGIACQLLDGAQTQRIHPVYESPGLNVLLIYPATDSECTARIEEKAADIERYIASNLSVYETALREIEGTLAPDSVSNAKRSLITILDEESGRIQPVSHLDETATPPTRIRRGSRRRPR